MKVISRFRAIILVALAMAVFSPCAKGQISNLFFSVLPSPTSVTVGSPVTYTINLTNNTGLGLVNLSVTNTWSPAVSFSSAQITFGIGSIFTNNASVAFVFGTMNFGDVLQMTVTVAPTNAGSLSDLVVIRTDTLTNFTTTNVVIQVTNTVQSGTDLLVSLASPPFSPLVNDLLTYTVTASNRGPSIASNVILKSDFLPFSGLKLISASPSGPFTNSTMVVNLGTMTNTSSRTFRLTVQPTNSGTLPFTTTVSSASITELNTANNTASTSSTVGPLVFGELIATNITIMKFNPQTSLMEQKIRLVNISSSNVPSARVMVLGLASPNWLFNAVGTNNTFGTNLNPFVVYGAPLNPGQSVDLLLEYVVPSRSAIGVTNTISYVAVGTAAFNESGPSGTNTSFSITGLPIILTNGSVLIEFQSITNKSYSVLYSSDPAFSTNLLAIPNITAQADRTQWVDDGPPKTVSHPSSVPQRFYRVRLNNP